MDLSSKRNLLSTLVLEPKSFTCEQGSFMVPADLHDLDALFSRIQVIANELPDYRDPLTGEVNWLHIFHVFTRALDRSHPCFLIAFFKHYEKLREKSRDPLVRDAERESFDLQLLNQTVSQLTHDAISHVRRFGTVPFTERVTPLNSAANPPPPPPPTSSAHYGPPSSPESSRSLARRPGQLRHAMSALSQFDDDQLHLEEEEATAYALSCVSSGEPAGQLSEVDQRQLNQVVLSHSLTTSAPAESYCQCCGFPSSVSEHALDKCQFRNHKDPGTSVSLYRVAEQKEQIRGIVLNSIETNGAFKHRTPEQKTRFREAVARAVAQIAENNRVKRGQYNSGSQYTSSNGSRPSNHYSAPAAAPAAPASAAALPPPPPSPSLSVPAPHLGVPGNTPVHPSREPRINRTG